MTKRLNLNIDLTKENHESLHAKLSATGVKFNELDVDKLLKNQKSIQYALIDAQNNIVMYATT